MSVPNLPLAEIEPRLRMLLPADLYALAWENQSPEMLVRVFEHLRTLQRTLHDYVPHQVWALPPKPGQVRYEWREDTLLFTDLVGFTQLSEANAERGRAGAEALLNVLNAYFAEMLEIIGKSGGDLFEFTGDALLTQFSSDLHHDDTAQAVRAGLRMQRAMGRLADLESPRGKYALRMRVGIHYGRFLTADIGTPRRMEHVLLGGAVLRAKQAEAAGQAGCVCLTLAAYERVRDQFRFEAHGPGHVLVVDDFSAEQLGEYDLAPPGHRPARRALWERSVEGLVAVIEQEVAAIEPLASYVPSSFLNLVVEGAARRQIAPDFPTPTILFVNLIGLSEAVDRARPGEEAAIVAGFSRAVARMNGAIEGRGGVLKKVTYHVGGPDMVIYFGVPHAHTDDAVRAAQAALALRDIVASLDLDVGGSPVQVTCHLGLARGPAFSAEIGEPHGRREFNVLGDAVNTAARLLHCAASNQILMTEAVYQEIAHHFDAEALGEVALKGKTLPVKIWELKGKRE